MDFTFPVLKIILAAKLVFWSSLLAISLIAGFMAASVAAHFFMNIWGISMRLQSMIIKIVAEVLTICLIVYVFSRLAYRCMQ